MDCLFYDNINGARKAITKILPGLLRVYNSYNGDERFYYLGFIFSPNKNGGYTIGRTIDIENLKKEINNLLKNEKEKALNSPALETIQKQYRELIKYIQSGEIHPDLGIPLNNPELVSHLDQDGRLVFLD